MTLAPALRILIACEFSGVVRNAFLARGHDAWSCVLRSGDEVAQHDCAAHFDDKLYRLGKKAAGRLLDGIEHNGFPEALR